MKNRYLGKSTIPLLRSNMEPKVLYKQSNLKKDFRTGEIRLMSVCFPEDETGTSVNADAKCQVILDPLMLTIGNKTWTLGKGGTPYHKEIPARICDCGFHAYNEYAPARDHDQKGNFVLRVVGSGKMFEYKQGYRYGHQRVEEIIVTECANYGCARNADRLRVFSYGDIQPVCSVCSSQRWIGAYSLMSFREFEEVASKGLPDNAPRITIRSEYSDVTAWEREVSKITGKPKSSPSLADRFWNNIDVIGPFLITMTLPFIGGVTAIIIHQLR